MKKNGGRTRYKKNINRILDVNLPGSIAQTKIYYKNSWKCNIKRRIWSWILEISINNFFNTYNSKTNTFYCFRCSKRWKNYLIWQKLNRENKKNYEDKPFKEGDKERCSSRIEKAEGRKTYIILFLKAKLQRYQIWKIWIHNIVCKVLK